MSGGCLRLPDLGGGATEANPRRVAPLGRRAGEAKTNIGRMPTAVPTRLLSYAGKPRPARAPAVSARSMTAAVAELPLSLPPTNAALPARAHRCVLTIPSSLASVSTR
jgi:hypothetical protein